MSAVESSCPPERRHGIDAEAEPLRASPRWEARSCKLLMDQVFPGWINSEPQTNLDIYT